MTKIAELETPAPVFPVERPVGQDYRKTHGRTAGAMQRDVLRVAQSKGAISTFECERDPKLAHAVTTMLASGEVLRGPEGYPWVGLRMPKAGCMDCALNPGLCDTHDTPNAEIKRRRSRPLE